MRSQTLEELAYRTLLLALSIGHYQTSYGALPENEMIALLHSNTADCEQTKLLAEGMQALIGVLGSSGAYHATPRRRRQPLLVAG
jgi:hypothetical protein